jgi:hypothetical protein
MENLLWLQEIWDVCGNASIPVPLHVGLHDRSSVIYYANNRVRDSPVGLTAEKISEHYVRPMKAIF